MILCRGLGFQVLEGFFDGGDEHGEAFADGFWVAGEVDDEGLAAGACGGAGEDGGGDVLEAFDAHDFAEARELLGEDGAGGFRCVITGGGAGAAGGEDELVGIRIAEATKEGFDFRRVIGEDVACPVDCGEVAPGEDALDFGSGEVFVDASAGAV